jgi:hypothetical protein
MNKFEKLIYNLLKSNPILKIFIRNVYQNILDFLPVNRIKVLNEFKYFKNFFFGFHDLNPFSIDNSTILANYSPLSDKYPSVNDSLEVGYINLSTNKFIKLGVSHTWNFHKGCRLQWVNNHKIIFNSHFNNSVFNSTIVNLKTEEEEIINFPIDTVSNDGKLATSFSYSRLEYLMGGYGYSQIDKENYNNKKAPIETGLSIVNIETNESYLLFSIKYLVEFAELNEFANKYHFYITHTSFSKNDSKVSFMLRWTTPNKTLKRYSIIFVYDFIKKKLVRLQTDFMVSHYVWLKEKILIYSRINKLDKHYILDPTSPNNFDILDENTLTSDGHQTSNLKGEIIVDTYPNSRRIQKLFYFKDMYSSGSLLGEFYHPKIFQSSNKKGHVCVDLHPRISADGLYVSFDSAYNNSRNLCILKIK